MNKGAGHRAQGAGKNKTVKKSLASSPAPMVLSLIYRYSRINSFRAE